MIGNDYTFSFAGRRYQIERERGASGHASSALARGTPPRRGVEGALSRPLRGDRRVRYAANRCAADGEQASSQRSQCGRPEQLDAGLLRPSQPAAVEVDRRLKCKTISAPGKPGARFLCPKPQLGSFTRSNGSSKTKGPPRRPVKTTRVLIAVGGPRRLLPEPTPSPRLWATAPGATPARLCEHTMRVASRPSKPELSTLVGTGTFYFGPTVPSLFSTPMQLVT